MFDEPMQAVQFDRFGDPEVLVLGRRGVPAVPPGTVLVRVLAAGVAPVDLGLRAGTTPMSRSLPLPHVPGVDAAGIVVAVGAGADASVGSEVYGSVDLRALGGATAEYAVLAMWAEKPAELSWEEAGAAASSIETATRALDLLGVGSGSTLLVEGAAGGVGSVVVQLAVGRGARVIGTGRAGHLDRIRELGVPAVELGTDPTAALAALGSDTIDAALDAAGAGTVPRLIALTGDPARVVTIADPGASQLGVRLPRGALAGEPDGSHGLLEANALAAQGRFRIPLRAVVPLTDPTAAHRAAEVRPRWGKVVVTMAAGGAS